MRDSLRAVLAVGSALVFYVGSYVAALSPVCVAGMYRWHRVAHYKVASLETGQGDGLGAAITRFYAPAQYLDEHCVRPNYWRKEQK
jgi:hypothetical protein